MWRTDFAGWLTEWLSHHPLKTPPESPEVSSSYTREVMARVRSLTEQDQQPAWNPSTSAWTEIRRWLRPRFVLALGGAVAAAAVAVVLMVPRQAQIVQSPEPEPRGEMQLAQLPPQQTLPALAPDSTRVTPADLGVAVASNQSRLAEETVSPSDDTTWILNTLQLLGELDDEDATTLSDESSIEESLKELRWLDEQQIASS